MTREMILEYSELICRWLETHPEFKINGMCEKLSINAGNFYKAQKMRSIPAKYIPPIIEFLSHYGFVADVAEQKAPMASNKPIPAPAPEKTPTIPEAPEKLRKKSDYDALIPAVNSRPELQALRTEILEHPDLPAPGKQKLILRIENKLKTIK
jgi:hypothetical protein